MNAAKITAFNFGAPLTIALRTALGREPEETPNSLSILSVYLETAWLQRSVFSEEEDRFASPHEPLLIFVEIASRGESTEANLSAFFDAWKKQADASLDEQKFLPSLASVTRELI